MCAVLAEQWTCISCGCRILWSHPDPGIKSFSRIHFSVATLFIQKLHLTDPAPGTSHCYCIPGASAILTEPSGCCDSWSGLKSKWCTQGGLILASSLTDPPTEQSSCGRSRGRGRVLIRLIASSESMAESHGQTKTDENGAQAGIVSGLKRAWKEFSHTRRTPAQKSTIFLHFGNYFTAVYWKESLNFGASSDRWQDSCKAHFFAWLLLQSFWSTSFVQFFAWLIFQTVSREICDLLQIWSMSLSNRMSLKQKCLFVENIVTINIS